MLGIHSHRSFGTILLTGVSSIALMSALGTPRAAAQSWNAGTGNWSNAGNWTPATVPNSSGASAVVNNGGNADADGSFTVGTLTIGNTSGVGINNNAALVIDGSLSNAGSLTLGSFGNSTDLRFANGVTMSGGGSVLLSDNPNNHIWGATNSGAEIVTNADNAISGAGAIGLSSSIGFINLAAGVVNATGLHSLVLSPTGNGAVVSALGGGFVNQGLMEATSTGGLVLNGGQFNNAGGTIMGVGAGNNVYLQSNVVVSGGTLTGTGGGLVQMTSGHAATLDGASQGALRNAGTFLVTNNSITGLTGTINNTGTILVGSTGNTTDLRIANGTTLTGSGAVVLSDNPNNRILGVTDSGAEITTNLNNTISGAGQCCGIERNAQIQPDDLGGEGGRQWPHDERSSGGRWGFQHHRHAAGPPAGDLPDILAEAGPDGKAACHGR